MINEMTMIIPGVPIAKKRPRFARRGKFVTTYNDQQTEEGRWLLSAREYIRETLKGPLDVPVKLQMVFRMPIPKSTTKNNLVKLSFHPEHAKKPDIDNLIKFCLDCLNGELFIDDALVCGITAEKKYDPSPETVIVVNW